MDITLTSPSGSMFWPAVADYQTYISTRFAALDYPDVFQMPTREYAFSLSDQGLVMDAKEVYPYLLLSNNYTTKNMIKWSTNSNGEIPFVTKCAIQDSNFGFAVREDWLQKLNMEWPTTKEDLLKFAKAVTFDDPDGNGKDDTYFMAGGGNGTGFGMLGGFESMFGNPAAHVEDGQLSHPYFNGTRKAFLSFVNELVNAKVLSPDWFTETWDKAWGLAANQKVAMVHFPSGALYQQVATNNMTEKTVERVNQWKYYPDAPIEGGKYSANGNVGYMWGFVKEKFEGQEGKLKRVAHMLDSTTVGGENFFHVLSFGTPEVYEAAGIEVKGERVYGYNDEGTMYYVATTKEEFPYGPAATDPDSDYYQPTAIWQMFGLMSSYQMNYVSDDMSEFDKTFNEKANEGNEIILNYERWPNDALLVTLTGSASEAQVGMQDWILAQEYAFAAGSRSLDEWDAFTTEWLNKGGKEIIQQTAEQLGVPVPDYAK